METAKVEGLQATAAYCDSCGRKRESDDEPWFYESYTSFETGHLPLEHCGRCWQEREERAARARRQYSEEAAARTREFHFRLYAPPAALRLPAPRVPKVEEAARAPEPCARFHDPPPPALRLPAPGAPMRWRRREAAHACLILALLLIVILVLGLAIR